jgi:V/A-type H+-transporting ATPase subunit D
MGKIKLTKGELKKQRDSLKRYERYLPILQLKKQQIQMEILHQLIALEESRRAETEKAGSAVTWAGLLSDEKIDIKPWIRPERIVAGTRNIAGVDIPVFKEVLFGDPAYDLFAMPLWVDMAIAELKALVAVREEIKAVEKSIAILRAELRVTTQRVNLFEKVKIPEAEESIRIIKIYIGDQMTNAVGRSKIAKRKIGETILEGAFA